MDIIEPQDVGFPYSQKFHLEGLLQRDPYNHDLLDAYYANLLELSNHSFGLLYASLPGYRAPIFFRGMKTDLLNMRQIFWQNEYGFATLEQPRRILDLGAYGGYAAVYFANRYPDAEIVCVEPSPASFRLLSINTEPYENIRRLHGAVWHQSTKLELIDRIGGDWGSVFGEQGSAAAASVQAYTVPEILRFADWPGADYIKCDIEGAEAELFSDAAAASDWLSDVSCLSIETHDRFKPGCTEAVERLLPENKFKHTRNGEFHIFIRHGDGRDPSENCDSSAERILLVPDILRPRRFDRVNVLSQPWAFCLVDDRTFQLHPNPPGQGRSEIRFHIELAHQRQFSAYCSLPPNSAHPVVFSVNLRGSDGVRFEEARVVVPGERGQLIFRVPEGVGPCQLGLGTEMAAGATTNGHAWARWTDAILQ